MLEEPPPLKPQEKRTLRHLKRVTEELEAKAAFTPNVSYIFLCFKITFKVSGKRRLDASYKVILYKYLSTIIRHKLTLQLNTDLISSKCQQLVREAITYHYLQHQCDEERQPDRSRPLLHPEHPLHSLLFFTFHSMTWELLK